jgi:hypothetical protein
VRNRRKQRRRVGHAQWHLAECIVWRAVLQDMGDKPRTEQVEIFQRIVAPSPAGDAVAAAVRARGRG